MRAHFTRKSWFSFNPEAAPPFDQQLGRIAFEAVLHPELHKPPVRGTDATEYLLDDPIFIVLRVNLVPIAQQTLWIGIAGFGHFGRPVVQELDLQSFRLQVYGGAAAAE